MEPAGLPGGGLFVIGVARGGTTILQNALNESQDIFLLGEPDLHLDRGGPGFAARFNAMHEGWANQPNKSSFLPPMLPDDGTWDAHFARLSQLYRWVGAKIVSNPGKSADWTERLLAFHFRHFYDARYLFTFRRPRDVLTSTIAFQALSGVPSSATTILSSYARTIALFTKLVRTLRFVRAIIHEDVNANVFQDLSEWLDVSLDGAIEYYDETRPHRHDISVISSAEQHGLGLLDEVFEDLRAAISVGFERLQIEQNSRNPDPAHFTAIGSIHSRVEMIDRYLLGQG